MTRIAICSVGQELSSCGCFAGPGWSSPSRCLSNLDRGVHSCFFCTQIPEDISLSDRKRSLFRMVVWPPLYLFALIYLYERRRRCPFGFRQISNVPSSFRESERKRVATLPWHTPLLCSLQLLKCEQYVSKCSVMRLCPIRQSLAAQDDLARI